MTAGYEVTINPQVWRQFKIAADQFDRGIVRGLRRRAKQIGAEGVDAVKQVLEQDTPGGVPNFSGDAREAIAASLRTQVLFGKRAGGVRIRTSAGALPTEHQAIVKAYNKKSFRHPVQGGTTWVTQEGRPYFGAVLLGRREEMQLKVMEAVSDGLRAMGARNP